MNKWIYEGLVMKNSEKSIEELTQEILSLEEIECTDRSFANECQSGTAIADINRLFDALENQKGKIPTEIYKVLEDAEHGWEYITNGIDKMNDNSRCFNVLKELKDSVDDARLYNKSVNYTL